MSRDHTYAQHFLRNPQIVSELIGHSNIRKNDTVYDLGAGSGVIASVLANRCSKVKAVEIEPVALKNLRKNLGNVLNVDILETSILDLAISESRYKIFSNIPFNMSAAIVRKFTETDTPPTAIYLIVQKQFARKLVPSDRHFTAQLGAQMIPFYSARIRKPLRKTDFTPPPNVDTVLLEIKPLEETLLPINQATVYRAFVETCFARQKYFVGLDKEAAKISSEKLPSQLTAAEWTQLFSLTKRA